MKIKTTDLAHLVEVAYKAASNNKIVPITQMIGIKVNDGKLTLAATDSFNYLYISAKVEDDTHMDVCVNADILFKLISKFTSEFTELVLKDNYLLVTGNGDYKLDLLLDEEGVVFKFPIKKVADNHNTQEIELSKFSNLKFYGEKSLAQTMEEPDLVAYFTNDEIGVSTDRNIMTLIKNPITDKALTLRSKFVELLVLMKEKINFHTWVNEATKEINIYAEDGVIEIFSKVNNSVDDYPYEAIKQLIETSEFETNGKITIKTLSAALDRIGLMVTPYDSNVIDVRLNEGKLFVSSVKSTGVEVIPIKDIDTTKSWAGKMDIEMLKSQLSSFTKDEVDIYLGNDNCIKLVEGNVTKLICLVNEE